MIPYTAHTRVHTLLTHDSIHCSHMIPCTACTWFHTLLTHDYILCPHMIAYTAHTWFQTYWYKCILTLHTLVGFVTDMYPNRVSSLLSKLFHTLITHLRFLITVHINRLHPDTHLEMFHTLLTLVKLCNLTLLCTFGTTRPFPPTEIRLGHNLWPLCVGIYSNTL
jgi:hypothetical protein